MQKLLPALLLAVTLSTLTGCSTLGTHHITCKPIVITSYLGTREATSGSHSAPKGVSLAMGQLILGDGTKRLRFPMIESILARKLDPEKTYTFYYNPPKRAPDGKYQFPQIIKVTLKGRTIYQNRN